MRIHKVAMLTAAALLMAGATSVSAMSTCVKDARQALQDCRQSCQDTFTAAKLTCQNVDPTCGEACLQGRGTCLAGVAQILATGQLPGGGSLANCTGGTAACDAALQQDRQGCWAQYCASGQTCSSCAQTTDPTSCYECVDPFQVTAFSCRDTCRDSFRQDATVKFAKGQCKSTFQSCIKACPPLPPS